MSQELGKSQIKGINLELKRARNDPGSPRVTCSHVRLSQKAILVISGGEIWHFQRRFGSVRGGIFLKLNLESTLGSIGKKKKKKWSLNFPTLLLFIYFYLKGFPILEYYYPIIPYSQLRSICKTAIFFSSFFFFFLMKVPFLLLKKHKLRKFDNVCGRILEPNKIINKRETQFCWMMSDCLIVPIYINSIIYMWCRLPLPRLLGV